MNQTYEDRLNHLHELYQNGGGGMDTLGVPLDLVQDTMTNHIEQPLIDMVNEKNIKTSLTTWRRFGTDLIIPNTMMQHAENKLNYLDIIEEDMFRLFKESRDAIEKQKINIMNAMKLKTKKEQNAEEQDVEDRIIEKKILQRLNDNTFPLDVVRYIGEFLFTPIIRLQCLMSSSIDIQLLMRKMKAPNIKRLYRITSRLTHSLSARFKKNDKLMSYLPYIENSSDDISSAFIVVKNPKKYTKQGQRKEQNNNIISSMIESCSIVTNAIHQLGFSRTAQKMSKDIIKMFHTVHYVSRHEFNKRKTSSSITQ